MIIFAPPSESKTTGCDTTPVDLDNLVFANQLRDARQRVGDALVDISEREDALEILGVGPRIADMVAANIDLWTAPTSPSLFVYTGVFFDALDSHSLPHRAREAADGHILVQSALWGVTRLEDRIPAYRLNMGVDFSTTDRPSHTAGNKGVENGPKYAEIGKLGAFWKPVMTPVLDDFCENQIVIDCRSGAYKTPWKPTAKQRKKLKIEMVDVRAVVRRGAGEKVVTHYTKFYRGLLTRELMLAGALDIDEVGDLVGVLDKLDDPHIIDFRLEESGPYAFDLTLVVNK